MSLSATLHSYFALIRKLHAQRYATREELINHVEKTLNIHREKAGKGEKGLSHRSFERDKANIRQLFGIDIQFCRKKKGYYIEGSSKDRLLQEIAQSFEMLQAVRSVPTLETCLQPDTRQDVGQEHLGLLLSAIQEKLQVQFTYLKHWESASTQRTVSPYLLKEAGGRWYLIASDTGGKQQAKTFGLDRMSDVVTTPHPSVLPADTGYLDKYQHCFGVDMPHDGEQPEAQEVVLSFDYHQGKYIKALPLHSSQKILADTESGLRIRLKVYLTWDFESEILSYGETVTVLQPRSLAERIQTRLRDTLDNYQP